MNHTGSPKKVIFSPDDVEIIQILNGKVIAKGVVDHTSNIYMFSHFLSYSNPSTLLIHVNEARKIWHEIFGHLNYTYLSDLSEKDMVIWLPNIKFYKGVCQGCILGKHPEHKYEKVSHERTSAPLELIHNDISGPFPHMSMIQAKYALTFCNTPVLTPLAYIVNNLGAELNAKATPQIWLCCVSDLEWSLMVYWDIWYIFNCGIMKTHIFN